MAARLKSNVPRVKTLAREDAARLLNVAGKGHADFSDLIAPEDTGALRKTIKVAEEATPDKLRVVVTAGGDSAPYAPHVEFGYRHYKSGQQIPGQFFFRQGFELGQQRVANHKVRLDG